MKHILLTTALLCAMALAAQSPNDACTSIMAGRGATTDGSVITSHTCDSWYRTWMDIRPARDYPRDTITEILGGTMHTEHSADRTGVTVRGTIPQASHTYAYLNTAYPCLNEHQLAIGETTFSGRSEMQNKKGLFNIEELARIALERCTTARSAIRLIGQLVKKYGYGDSGECLTIADKREVWIFEIVGEGPKRVGGVWAACRIPDDHVAVSANISRISRVDIADTANCMASENVFKVARDMGLWDGRRPFSFWRAYHGRNFLGEEKNYSVRELYIMQQLAPSAGFTAQMDELPLSVRPDQKVDVATVSRLLGSYYEGTDKCLADRLRIPGKDGGDSIVSPRANPWMRPDEIALYSSLLADTAMKNIRTVSVSWCAYSTVIQCRAWLPDAVGGVAWVGLDCPGQSPRFPIFAGTTDLPRLLKTCGQHRDRSDAALTHFRHANRLATVRWGSARKTMEPARDRFLTRGLREQAYVADTYVALPEADRADYLTQYTADFFAAELMAWDDLAARYWRMFWGGF